MTAAFTSRPKPDKPDKQAATRRMKQRVVSQFGHEVARGLLTRGVPAGCSLHQIEQTVMQSIAAYVQVISFTSERLFKDRPVLNEPYLVNPYQVFLEELWNGFIRSPEPFVMDWMEDVRQRLLEWKHWRGNLTKYAFTFDAATFQNEGRAWCIQYSGSTEHWERFRREFRQSTWGK